MVRLEITGGHASALDGIQWARWTGPGWAVVERGRWARGTCLDGDGLGEASRDLRLNGTPCVGGNGCRRACESVLQESWRVAGVSQQRERWWRWLGVARARESWVQRVEGALGTWCVQRRRSAATQTRMHCRRRCVVVVLMMARLSLDGDVRDRQAGGVAGWQRCGGGRGKTGRSSRALVAV